MTALWSTVWNHLVYTLKLKPIFYGIWILCILCYYWELREQEKPSSRVRQPGKQNLKQNLLLTTNELVTHNMCGIMKYWTSLRPNKTLPFLFLCVTVSCRQGKSYINHSLSLPIRKTYCSPCFCVFLVHLFEKQLLSLILCHSNGTKWTNLLPFAVVELFLFICAFRGVSSRVMGCPSGSFVPCTRNIYVKMTSPSFQQDVSDVGVTQYEMHLVIEASPA